MPHSCTVLTWVRQQGNKGKKHTQTRRKAKIPDSSHLVSQVERLQCPEVLFMMHSWAGWWGCCVQLNMEADLIFIGANLRPQTSRRKRLQWRISPSIVSILPQTQERLCYPSAPHLRKTLSLHGDESLGSLIWTCHVSKRSLRTVLSPLDCHLKELRTFLTTCSLVYLFVLFKINWARACVLVTKQWG